MYSHSGLCTTLFHIIIKIGYYSRHIPKTGTICHQIPEMFQFRNQYQVKSNEMAIYALPNTQPHILGDRV